MTTAGIKRTISNILRMNTIGHQVATFPVARRIVVIVGAVPAGERFNKFFENSLT